MVQERVKPRKEHKHQYVNDTWATAAPKRILAIEGTSQFLKAINKNQNKMVLRKDTHSCDGTVLLGNDSSSSDDNCGSVSRRLSTTRRRTNTEADIEFKSEKRRTALALLCQHGLKQLQNTNITKKKLNHRNSSI
jgi:hypothetical protein